MTTPDTPDDEAGGPTVELVRRRRTRRLRVAVGVLALAGVTAVGLASRDGSRGPVNAGDGKRAPEFTVASLRDGDDISLADLRGRPLVLNFWASWCVPCRKELPSFERVNRSLREEVTFLGINHQDSRSRALDLLAESGVTFRSGYDPEGKVGRAYGLYGMPTTVFITADGRVAATHAGEMKQADLEAAIADLFGVERV